MKRILYPELVAILSFGRLLADAPKSGERQSAPPLPSSSFRLVIDRRD
ncbi:hypothetical protein R75461_04805 [Paraburkholderia nemoris]|nr:MULTISPECIES: hypothetical protein [Paraburkholderia]MBK3783142.1 hypothetical protein [Paraburkholderia aspalathi]MCI0150680.1 hypothetical protein [Paraburkholderia sediminicola]CAE6686023.1 hypothetical protein LMG22931_00066 [Paraburkholderia nemoris]CAE6792609.1 hypothetical protein R75461_04805 [Paraburkholderia nemoris]